MNQEEIDVRINEIDNKLNEIQYHCLETFTWIRDNSYNTLASIHQFHGVIGGKNNFADCKNGQFLNFNEFWKSWLKGLLEHVKQNKNSLIKKVIEDDLLREYTKLFLERNYYRNYYARIRNKPLESLTEIWFGNNGSNMYGLFIAPNAYGNKWYNKDKQIRDARFEYWTIEHILSTGFVTENATDGVIKFNKLEELIQFYKIHIKRASNSEYEKFFIDKYLEFVLNHNNPNKLPILIPELRFWGEKKEHKYRLDFTILNIYTQRFVGFEISPSSSHMHVQKTKNKSQAEINSEISTQWQKEMTKRNDYFSKFNITLITFTDNDLNDLDKCFDTIKNELKINLDTKTDNDYINLIKQI